MGFDQPSPCIVKWLQRTLSGDLAAPCAPRSRLGDAATRRSVTLELTFLAVLLSVINGIPGASSPRSAQQWDRFFAVSFPPWAAWRSPISGPASELIRCSRCSSAGAAVRLLAVHRDPIRNLPDILRR
jgi:hypothetical protein